MCDNFACGCGRCSGTLARRSSRLASPSGGGALRGRRLGLRHESERALPTRARQLVDAGDVATDAKTTVAAKVTIAIEHRKARQLHRQPFAALVHRPGDNDAAPCFMRRDCARHLIFRIELQFGGNLAPQSAECPRGSRPDQFHELVGADNETALGIHLPNEAERMAPFRRGFTLRNACGDLWRRGGLRSAVLRPAKAPAFPARLRVRLSTGVGSLFAGALSITGASTRGGAPNLTTSTADASRPRRSTVTGP